MQARAALGSALSNHMQVIWYNWIAILVLILCYVISAIAGAASAASKAYGFVAIWTMLLLIGYAVGGTMIVRQPKYRSPLSVGFLIGVSLMMVFLLLELGVISGANMARFGGSDTSSSTQAVTAFASLLLIAETTFTVFVILYRDTLLPPQPMTSSDHSEVPPSLPGGAFSGTAAGSTGGYPGGPSIGPYSGSDSYGDKSGVAGGYDTTEHVSITPTIGGSTAGGSGQGVL